MNAYEMFTELRANLGEATAAQWTDMELLRKLNAAQRMVSMTMMLSLGDWLMAQSSVTPVASVITLPGDCAKPVYLERTSDGAEISIRGTVRERRRTRPQATNYFAGMLDAYFEGGTLVVNSDGFTDACTLWYQQRVTDLIAGTADTGSGALAIVIPTSAGPSYVDDYYNDVVLEVVAGTLVGTVQTVSDYTGSTRTCVITGTAATSTIFGSRSVLPVECHDLIVVMATVQAIAKPSSALDVEVFRYWAALLKEAKKDFAEWVASRESGSQHVRVLEDT